MGSRLYFLVFRLSTKSTLAFTTMQEKINKDFQRRDGASRTHGIILDCRQLGAVLPDSFRGVKETCLGGRDHSNDDRSVAQRVTGLCVSEPGITYRAFPPFAISSVVFGLVSTGHSVKRAKACIA